MARYRLIFVLSLMVAMGGQPLQAGGHPDFSGIWKLDLNAPQATSLDAILEAQGASWIERKSVDTLSITQVIAQTEKTLTIKIETALGGRTRVLHLDGRPHIQDTDRIGKSESRSFWDEDNTTLVTVTKSTPSDDPKNDIQKAVYTTRRYLQDEGRTLIVDHILIFEDGRKLTGRRVLRRQ